MSAPLRPVTELPRTVPVGAARRTMAMVRRVRLHVVFGLLLAAFGGLILRLVHVQLVHGDEWREQVDSQERWKETRPVRGSITDRHGRPLAISRPVRHVVAEAGGVWSERKKTYVAAIPDVARFATSVSDLLDGTPTALEIRTKIQERRRRGDYAPSGSGVLALRRNVDDPRIVARLAEARVDGLQARVGDRREYPNGSWGGHVIGLARAPDLFAAEEGVEGIEKDLDAILVGVVTRRRFSTDGRGRILAPKGAHHAVDADGRDVRLALDLVIQGYCEQALDRMCWDWKLQQACAIVLDPATGDVLGLACRPEFDPSLGAGGAKLCVATQAVVEVGSTFKPFTAARALAKGLAGPDEVFELPPRRTFRFGAREELIRDSHDGGSPHGAGTLVDVIAQSNNPDSAELAYRLGPDGMKELIADLGIEERWPIPGFESRESRGGVNWKKRGVADHLRYGFGHAMTQTPLRLAANFCAFARSDFRPVTPRLVLEVAGEPLPEGPLLAPLLTDPRRQDVIRRGLRACVTEGTAAKTVLSPRLAIAGKTGTAKKPGDDHDRYYSCSFAGYAPAAAPRLVCLVLALEPTSVDGKKPYGGAVAGPAVRSILERSLCDYMGVPSADASSAEGRPAPSAAPDAAVAPASPPVAAGAPEDVR